MSAAHFCLTARDCYPVLLATPISGGCAHRAESARCQWPPVVTAHMGCPPPIIAPDVTEEAAAQFTFPLPPFGRAPRCSALHWPPLHRRRPSSMSHPKLSDRAKRSASSPCPSGTRSLSAVPANKAGPRDFPRRCLPP
jgi:hypothetical protein